MYKKYLLISAGLLFFLLYHPTNSPKYFSIAKEVSPNFKILKYEKVHDDSVTSQQLTDISLSLTNQEKLQVDTEKKIKYESVLSLIDHDKDHLFTAIQDEKEKNLEEIKMLWEETVKKSTVIQFAIDKLSTPLEGRRIKSSKMARSIATLISGAAILPSLFGAGDLASMSTYAGGGSLARVIANQSKQENIPLSDTELIQLASLLDTLQEQVVNDYYKYKYLIKNLAIEKNNLKILKDNYDQAVAGDEPLAALTASMLYDKAQLKELKLKQELKQSRVNLERLAGIEAVTSINITEPDTLIPMTYNLASEKDFNFDYRKNLIIPEKPLKESISSKQAKNTKQVAAKSKKPQKTGQKDNTHDGTLLNVIKKGK